MSSREQGKNGVGASAPAPSGPQTHLEAIEMLLGNLFIMQQLAVAKLDALVDVLQAKGVLTPSDLEAIDADIRAVLGETSISDMVGDSCKVPR